MKITRDYRTEEGYDVIVCGGGPSGVAAAIASARAGAKTLLIEQGGCLGGMWTRGLLTWLIDTFGHNGLINEMMERLEQEADGAAFRQMPRFTADTEKTKLVFEKMCQEAGVALLYHTFVCGAVVEERAIRYVLTESKDGPVAYGAKLFVDTTGDGDLGYHAGVSYRIGNDEGVTQPMSLIAQVSGLDLDDMLPYDSRRSENKSTKKRLLADMASVDVYPSYKSPLLAVLSEKYHRYGLMMNHEYMSGLSARNLTQSTVSARAEIHAAVDALRSIGGMWEDVHITSTADMIGVREGRRLKGLYEVNKEDVSAGRCFEDAVCTIWFDTDVHNLKPGDHSSKYGTVHPPYQIPLRSLISAEIDNLLMGGRCISGDFVAHGSYRVAGPAFRTGEVAGKAAAHCALNGILPKDIRCVQDVLGSEE